MTLHALASVRFQDTAWTRARSEALADARSLLARTDGGPAALGRAEDAFYASWSSAARFKGIWHEAQRLHRRTEPTATTKDPDAPPLPAG